MVYTIAAISITETPQLYIHNKEVMYPSEIRQLTLGKRWFAVRYGDGHVDMYNKVSGKSIYSGENIDSISKLSVYNDKCSLITMIRHDSRYLLILNNKVGEIAYKIDNVSNVCIDKRLQVETSITTNIDGIQKKVYLTADMELVE